MMQIRRQLTGDRTDLIGASVAETALMLQSIRHEIIRCERRIDDKLISQQSRDIEYQSVKVLRAMQFHLNGLFADRNAAE